MQSLIGQQLGDYLLERELGRGSMGAVYYARQVSSGKPFAVKVLLDALASDMSFVTRFTREARIIARLHHPNIIRVYEAGRQGQHIYFVMEFFAGTTVGRLLKERGRLAVGYAIEIAAQAADALQYAHDEGRLIHRDIKPENLMVDRWCRVKMLDFGLARVEGLQSITRAGTVVGSLYYVPPEQLLGQPIDSRTDIYALGVSLYEMVTSQRPFRGQNLTDMSRAILSTTPIPPSQIEPSVPPELEAIINHAMARDLIQRYSHASELLADLRALQVTLAGVPTSEHAEIAPPQFGAEPVNVTHPHSTRPSDAQLPSGQTQPRPSLGPQMRDRS